MEKRQESGAFRTDINVEHAASLIEGSVEHIAHEYFIYREEKTVEEYLDTIYQLLHGFLCKKDNSQMTMH